MDAIAVRRGADAMHFQRRREDRADAWRGLNDEAGFWKIGWTCRRNALSSSAQRPDIGAVDQNPAGAGLYKAQHHAQKRRFSRARFADDAEVRFRSRSGRRLKLLGNRSPG